MFNALQVSALPINPIYVEYFLGLLFYIAFLSMLYPVLKDLTSEGIVDSKTGGTVIAVFGSLMIAGFSGFLIFLYVFELIAIVIALSSLIAGVELIRVAKPSIAGLMVFVFGVAVDLMQWVSGFGMLYWVAVVIQVIGVSACFFDKVVRELLKGVIGDFTLPLLLVTMILADIMQYSQGLLAQFSEAAFAAGGCIALLVKYYLRKNRRSLNVQSTRSAKKTRRVSGNFLKGLHFWIATCQRSKW